MFFLKKGHQHLRQNAKHARGMENHYGAVTCSACGRFYSEIENVKFPCKKKKKTIL